MIDAKSQAGAERSPTGTQLLDKALDMVDLIERSSQRLSANAIALASGYPKPTVNRILSALVRRGFLAVDRRDQTYELGMRFMQMAATLRRSHRLVALVEEELIALSSRTGEAVSLGVPEPATVRIVGRYQMGLESQPGGPTGAKRPYHATAIGKAILAGMDEKPMQKLLGRIEFTRFTANTLADSAALLPDLKLVRARGYSFDEEEIVSGVRCVGVPLFAMHGELVGAVSLSAPAHRMPTGRVNEIVAALSSIAEKVSTRMHAPRTDERASEGVVCLRAGGLFRPIVIALDDDGIRVVDAGVPAIYHFSSGGELRNALRLEAMPEVAALEPGGGVLLARQENLQFLRGKTQKTIAFKSPVTALAFAPDGRAFAAVGEALHDGVSGGRLFAVGGNVMAMSAGNNRLYLLKPNMVEVRDARVGKLVKRFPIQAAIGAHSAIASNGSHIWISGPDSWRLDRIEIATGVTVRLTAPERSITALAVSDDSLLMAGSNLHASLIDKVEHNSGSLYRLDHAAA